MTRECWRCMFDITLMMCTLAKCRQNNVLLHANTRRHANCKYDELLTGWCTVCDDRQKTSLYSKYIRMLLLLSVCCNRHIRHVSVSQTVPLCQFFEVPQGTILQYNWEGMVLTRSMVVQGVEVGIPYPTEWTVIIAPSSFMVLSDADSTLIFALFRGSTRSWKRQNRHFAPASL